MAQDDQITDSSMVEKSTKRSSSSNEEINKSPSIKPSNKIFNNTPNFVYKIVIYLINPLTV